MNIKGLLVTVSALSISASAFAMDKVSQLSDNSGSVVNSVQSLSVDQMSGTAQSVSSSATGARTSVSVSSLSTSQQQGGLTVAPVGGIGNVNQASINTGSVTNETGFVSVGRGSDLGAASSVSVSATGAASGASLFVLGKDGVINFTMGDVDQRADNAGRVSNLVQDVAVQSLQGAASSVSVSATGASNGVSQNFVSASLPAGTYLQTGNVSQDASNYATVSNQIGAGSVTAGTVGGNGASVSVSASGASNGVSTVLIDSAGKAAFLTGAVNQAATNTGVIVNSATDVATGDVTGTGASVSVGATGASNAHSLVVMGSNDPNVAAINLGLTQVSENSGSVVNHVSTISVGNVVGAAASVSASATGASSSQTVANIGNPGLISSTSSGPINQSATNTGLVANNASSLVATSLNGIGASLSASATGASVSKNAVSINGGPVLIADLSSVTQNAINAGPVTNNLTNLSAGTMFGTGASISSSAVGASASVSFASLHN
ncbi:hypothetical protein [Rhizobium sp. SSA_523]|uniref:beta strand repeat-containing protein n=1 Tax=Rhizobium sp. SSA_523 TaxID=2952477 RepID=UPI0020914926|nr:hypothetical protein [Rhizobium sp. SSA_523]MCO5730500.1 hypothetical protein [Rhizobium sp. SSA_523]WKC25539.1 hypothetical protein QTJ18_16395 [Rhizobium sp. SSA_523]